MSRAIRADVRDYLIANPGAPAAEAAALFGLSVTSIYAYRSDLRRHYSLPRMPGSRHDPKALAEAVDLLDGGLSLRTVARRLGSTPDAVVARLNRANITVRAIRAERVYTTTTFAALFGYAAGYARRWFAKCRAAGLHAVVGGRRRNKRGAPWLISSEALMAWLDDPRGWHLWSPAQIADPDWRAYAHDARAKEHSYAAD